MATCTIDGKGEFDWQRCGCSREHVHAHRPGVCSCEALMLECAGSQQSDRLRCLGCCQHCNAWYGCWVQHPNGCKVGSCSQRVRGAHILTIVIAIQESACQRTGTRAADSCSTHHTHPHVHLACTALHVLRPTSKLQCFLQQLQGSFAPLHRHLICRHRHRLPASLRTRLQVLQRAAAPLAT